MARAIPVLWLLLLVTPAASAQAQDGQAAMDKTKTTRGWPVARERQKALGHGEQRVFSFLSS